MLISVVIPTCDRPIEYVRKSIQSALDQSIQPHEIILVDNGVTPINAESVPLDVIIHRSAPLIGPSMARNIGAMHATGSHLAFLDDDDWWDKRFLEEALNIMRAGPYQCVYGKLIQSRSGELIEKTSLTKEDLTIDVLLKTNPGTGGINILISKELFENIGGFDEKLKISEDRSLAIEVLRTGAEIGVAPKALAFARLHDGEQQKNRNSEKLKFVLKYRSLMPVALFLRHVLKFGIWIYIRPRQWRRR